MQLQTILDFLKRPIVMAVLAVILGFVLGLGWGWGVDPVKFVDSTPAYMRADLQEDYLRMAIDSLAVNADVNAAIRRWQDLGPNGPALLAKVTGDPQGLNPQAIAAFNQIAVQYPPNNTGGATSAPGTTAPPASAISIGTWVISIAGVLILAVAVIAGFIFLRGLLSKRGGGPANWGTKSTPSPISDAIRHSKEIKPTDFGESNVADPLSHIMSSYAHGDKLYDESFPINSGSGEMLGEYGMGISEKIGVGEDKKVTAFEVWLFDKNDVKTDTKVLLSNYANNDPEIKERLSRKGELILLQPDTRVYLETQNLLLLLIIKGMEYGQGPQPEDSYFQKLDVEFAAWKKE